MEQNRTGRLHTLWVITINGCFWNLLVALSHWAGILKGTLVAEVNLLFSLILIALVVMSALSLAHHPRVPANFRQRILITNGVAIVIALITEWY